MKTNLVLLIMLSIVIRVINCLMILEEDKRVNKFLNPQILVETLTLNLPLLPGRR
jgi:hypothetical protein